MSDLFRDQGRQALFDEAADRLLRTMRSAMEKPYPELTHGRLDGLILARRETDDGEDLR